MRDASGNPFSAQTTIAPSGQWQQVTGVLNASNGIMNCYVNGQLAASAVAPFTLKTNQQEVSIGNHETAGGVYQNAFTGIIDDAKIYNRDLTSADVSALYAAKPAPLVVLWQSTNMDVVAGVTAQLAPALTGGIPPYSYQWQLNGSNISGATAYPLVLSNAGSANAGSYGLILSDSNIVPAVTSSVVAVTIVPYLTFNSNGLTWMTQGSTASNVWQGTNIAQLTPLSNNQSNSVFYAFPLNIGAFQASFTYQVTQTPSGSTGPGDGLVFCIEDDPRGASALGYAGNGLGVGDVSNIVTSLAIVPSVELELNINSANTTVTGISWNTNGELGPVISSFPVSLANKDTINVNITYEDGLVTATLTDTNNGTEFDLSTNLDIPGTLGSANGYVGFTASTASGYAAQQVSDFVFQSLVTLTITTSSNTALISWPTGVGGYVLQKNSDLTTTNWVNVTNAVNLVNGQNQVSVPVTGTSQFYQLVLPGM